MTINTPELVLQMRAVADSLSKPSSAPQVVEETADLISSWADAVERMMQLSEATEAANQAFKDAIAAAKAYTPLA